MLASLCSPLIIQLLADRPYHDDSDDDGDNHDDDDNDDKINN